jgi:hypothetical protein
MTDLVEYPFSAFTIQYPVDKDNPDPLRDNKPFVEYDPEEGWTFYRVELKPGKTPDDSERYRLELDDNDKRILLDRQSDYHEQMVMIFDDHITYQANADFYSDRFLLNHFCLPNYEGQCHNNLCYEKSIEYTRDSDNTYKGNVSSFSCTPNKDSETNLNPGLETIQLIDGNLQFEQWDFRGEHYLSHRKTFDTGSFPSILGDSFGFYDIHAQRIPYYDIEHTYFEIFIDKPILKYNGEIHYSDCYEEYLEDKRDLCVALCKRINGEIMVSIETLAKLLSFSCYNDFDNDSNTCKWSIDIPYHLPGDNESIEYTIGSNIAECKHRDPIEMSVPAMRYDGTTEISHWSECSSIYIPIFTVLDQIPRYNKVKGYYYRPMTDSILVTTQMRNR